MYFVTVLFTHHFPVILAIRWR